MAFDGSKVIEPLAYSGMAEFGIPDGVIKEPTNDALVTFITAIQALSDESENASGTDVLAQVQEATSQFCSGVPTKEQFAALPPRLFREFAKWLASEFIDPKE